MRIHTLKTSRLSFSGRILERGFWLYLWRIRCDSDEAWYVGRTGDSSSANAASPFTRIGSHLNLKPTAKGNTLAKNIRSAGFEPANCDFDLLTIGPLFPEQSTFDEHMPLRDIVARLEAELAEHVRSKGHRVLGSHPKRGTYDQDLFAEVVVAVDDFLTN